MPNIVNIKRNEIDLKNLSKTTTEEDTSININEDISIIKSKPKKLKKEKIKKISEKDIQEKQKIIFKIQKYQENRRFSPILKKLNFKYTYTQLNKFNISELNEILQRIYVNINNDGIDKIYDLLVSQTTTTFEKVVSPFYDIEGFSNSLLCDDAFLNIVERYKIENNNLMEIPLSVQLGLCVSKHIVLCNTINKHKKNKPEKTINLNKNYKIKKPTIDTSIL